MPGDIGSRDTPTLGHTSLEELATGGIAAAPVVAGPLALDDAAARGINEIASKHGGAAGNDMAEMGEEKKREEPQRTVAFTSLFKYADRYDVSLMVLGTIGAMGLGISLPLLSLLFGELTDAFGQNTQDVKKLADQVTATALKFVWVALGASAAAYLEMACWMLTGERQASRIRSKFLRAVLRQDVGFFDVDTSTGELVGRMSGDIVLVQEAMGEKVGQYIRLMTTFVGGFAMAFSRGWLLTLVMLAALPLLAIAGGVVTWVIGRASSKGQEAYGAAGNVVEQCLGAIRTVVSFTGEAKAEQQYGTTLDQAYRMGCRQGLFSGLGMGTTMFVMFSSYALALWCGSLFIANGIGSYTGGKVMTVLFAVIIGGMSLGQASPNLAAFASGRAAAAKIFEVIERVPSIDVYDLSGATPSKVIGKIELKHVEFHYPARSDVNIFTDFSLVIPAGKTVALVGESGSGKSTIIALIERFYDPVAGQVLLDGLDLRSLQLRWLRQQIGLVSQEPVLFGTSIRENIAYGKEDASTEDIVEAAKMANVHAFISSLPQGYDTEVGERGTQLSGGQKQRVAIARAVIKNPRILLLDEATSALDAESEHLVQEALERAMLERTTVVVAHRLTTVRSADLIAVLQRGVMVEAGSHAELVHRAGGAYAQLVHLQQVHHERAGEGHEAKGHSQAASLVQGPLEAEAVQAAAGDQGGDVADLEPSGKASQRGAEKARKEAKKDVSFWRLARLNKPEAPLALLGAVAAGGQGAVFPVFSILLSRIIRAFYETDVSKLRQDANFWSLMFLVLALACLTMMTVQLWMFAIVGSALVRRVRLLCFSAVLRQEIAYFDDRENSSGAIGARLSTDAARVRAMVGDQLALMVQNLVTIVAGMVIAFTANWTLTLVVLAVVPLLVVSGTMQMKALKGFSENAKVMYEDASSVANDAVSSIRTVAAFGAEGKVAQLYDTKCSLPIQAGIRRGHVSGLGLGFSNFVMFATYALAFWYGGRLVEEGRTSFDMVFQVFFAIVMSAMGVAQTSSLAPDMTVVQIAVNSIFNMLDRKSAIDASAPGKVLGTLKGEIELRNVAFRYPARPDLLVFQNLSLRIEAGQTVALVGESGSGKSTVISLVERFYDPEAGAVLVDGVDIKGLQLQWLRQQIGLVSQEPVLFNTSIRANIAYGHDGASEAEITAAAMAANAHKFISALPQGYDTLVGERGVQLSGGQKQRVAIARAIVKNPRILLLDEATSALDAESERVVQDALDRVMVGRTTVVVAHRLSTIQNADTIAVVQKGILVEQGRHEELLGIPGGAYAALVKLQQHSS